MGNLVQSNIHDVAIHTVFDGPKDQSGSVTWSLYHLEKGVLRRGQKKVALRYGESVKQLTLDFAKEIKKYGVRALYLRVELVLSGKAVSHQTVFFTAPRYLSFKPGKIVAQLKKLGPTRFALTLSSKVYQHAAAFHFRGVAYRAEDNFFDLFPGSSRQVEIRTRKDLSVAELKKRLETTSLVFSYR
jgi:beta-mannosidase